MNKLILTICFCLLLSVPYAVGPNPPQAKNQPIKTQYDYAAVINGEKISMPEFEQSLQSAKDNLLKQSDIDFESEEGKFILATTQRSILDDLINQKLVKQQADKMNVTVAPEEIAKEIQQLKKSFPSDRLFKETLSEENVNEQELEQGVHDRLIVEKIKKILAKDLEVSDREVNNFVKQNSLVFKTEESPSLNGEEDVSANYRPTFQDNEKSREEAHKYLLTKKQNEIYERWFSKIKKNSKIEVNPDLEEQNAIQNDENYQKEGLPHGNISGLDGV
jgi:hypothetical protein